MGLCRASTVIPGDPSGSGDVRSTVQAVVWEMNEYNMHVHHDVNYCLGLIPRPGVRRLSLGTLPGSYKDDGPPLTRAAGK